ncbi:hypothetical protein GQ43DRAFT_158266 [Delitschia confertaspora ATCC 74209]|uniref:RRM domain-containing protein n=1 Tax=Delitschia confertaspora ATCC 74209 TaxID=1513339 RepID=A0A9P4MX82_9PLEO|nr:hypothetical protein GQ43DRAFT_158266 [Delitschia confertaspora ATCC 74209]
MSSAGSSQNQNLGKEEDYFIVPTGLPSHWTWQDFKDDVRKYVNNQPGWVDIKPSTRPGGGKEGWCRISQREDAERAYNRYAHAKSGVNVHLFATSLKSEGNYTLLRCNCDIQFGVAPGSHSPIRSGIDISAVSASIFRQQQNLLPQVAAPAPYAYAYPAYPMAQAYACAPQYAYAATMPQPVYTATPGGLPVNVGSGAMVTESRGIFISNLSYSATTSELTTLLHSVGIRPLEVHIQKDSRTGKSKGTATAKFGTKEEANYAVSRLNHHSHMNKPLKVRLDTESTIVGQVQGPVIVNGSNSRRVSAVMPPRRSVRGMQRDHADHE